MEPQFLSLGKSESYKNAPDNENGGLYRGDKSKDFGENTFLQDEANYGVFDDEEPSGEYMSNSEPNWLLKFIQEAFRIEEEETKTRDEVANNIQKEVQREVWREGAKIALKDCPVSAFMLEHSLQDNPTTMVGGNESDIAKLIVKDPVYLNALDKAIKNSDGKTIDTDLEDIAFKTPDLYYSIHRATIHVKGYKNKDGKWIINAMLEDTYDFTEWMTLSKNEDGKWTINMSKGTVANDAAVVSQFLGAINPYEIRVYFNTVR